jgi:hypothetical protein
VRLEVTPPEAEVYVDGFLAGSVEEFDGFFQHLSLDPGAREIVIYLDGYRTLREKLHVSPGRSYKLKRVLEPLATGETSEPPPRETRPMPPVRVEKTPGLERMPSGFVAAPDFKFSEIDSESANLLGGYAGWFTDRKLFLGAGAYFLTSGPAGADLKYGGGLVEWFARRSDRFNLSFRGLVGAGSGSVAVGLDDLPEPLTGGRPARRPRFHGFPRGARIEEGFFVAEPQAALSYAFTSWLRLGAGAGYRFVGLADGLEDRFRGPTASAFLQFGTVY